ncbi:SDR family NAD(P)-dependent oxidoreductase [Caldimonas thermodepolymerans]|uniref:3-hydroxyacyl-CoA dehydrogenase n=1 Tax=Caldimonas thermodepolymerans TaxID=215580 RepID=A0A2S5T5Y5_9BURK|nr:SDR family NAD(P)-dependent oxidoreductase [Caldimonas thermodepolymerans]PPE70366.1 3-hydroxyacyl-CoA dehydrogenase [Caldimonas thermodepolymerans]QPC30274.1 SDR family NAD(P)-dependent oxidoreductase [Caldimonas thermodepolymerans]RDI00668.1 short-subunit dehydrogenase [Caldimonas thermodepolymerans]TCP07053.1 short-subunit dehydrogenase [Caldimonas thermodepolymerans]UZG43035.1 SDR family NAD(P)-dependent oxidoreductase [Caldimonas thermodepolymerans]
MGLPGRHAVVTGAARGIGAAIARTLAAEGARLTLMGRHHDALQALARELPGGPHAAVAVDVAEAEAVQAAFAAARGRLGPVAILVNNAGQAESAPFRKTSAALWQRMLAVNLTGSFLCAQQALPDMLEAGWGRIVNIASTAGLKGYAYVSAYVAAKHGVVGLTRALALEVARQGVTVNAVCPGYTDTDILRDSIARVVEKTGRSAGEVRAQFAAGNPQGRIVQPQEVADAVRWLCGEAAGAVNGQAIAICGGELA